MLHQIKIYFLSTDLNSLPKHSISAKIVVNKIGENGENKKIGETEIVDEIQHPHWRTPIGLNYSVKQSEELYEAQLMDDGLGVETVLGSVLFKLAEVITSKGEFIYK